MGEIVGVLMAAAMGVVGVASKRAVSIPELMAALRARLRPMDERIEEIKDRCYAWQRIEAQRPGATVYSSAPPEADAAVAEQNHKKRVAKHDFYRSHEADLRAAREALFNDLSEKLAAAVEANTAVIDFERSLRTLQAACEEPIGSSLAFPNLEPFQWQAWHARCKSVLHPPKPRPVASAEQNRLEL
jgi:hypothetical protein